MTPADRFVQSLKVLPSIQSPERDFKMALHDQPLINKPSQVPILGLRTCMSSLDTVESFRPHPTGTVRIAFDRWKNLGTPNIRLFGAQ